MGEAVNEADEQESFLRTVFDDRIVTVPNLLSLLRLLAIPLFLWLLFDQDNEAGAAALLAVLGATDWVDGQIARRFNQVSELGKLLDPAADRLLLIVVVVAVTVDGAVPLWFGIPVMIREPLMFLAVIVLGLMGATRIDVTWWGKFGTAGLMFAFPLLLWGADESLSWAEVPRTIGWMFGIPGLVLSYYATILYIPMARRALAEGRQEQG